MRQEQVSQYFFVEIKSVRTSSSSSRRLPIERISKAVFRAHVRCNYSWAFRTGSRWRWLKTFLSFGGPNSQVDASFLSRLRSLFRMGKPL